MITLCTRAYNTDEAGTLLQIQPDPQQIFKPEAFKEQLYMKVKCKRNENPENLRASIVKVGVYSIALSAKSIVVPDQLTRYPTPQYQSRVCASNCLYQITFTLVTVTAPARTARGPICKRALTFYACKNCPVSNT
jgi:hypothetical protein